MLGTSELRERCSVALLTLFEAACMASKYRHCPCCVDEGYASVQYLRLQRPISMPQRHTKLALLINVCYSESIGGVGSMRNKLPRLVRHNRYSSK